MRITGRLGAWTALAALAAASGCGRRAQVRTPPAPRVGAVETGVASWYGHPYHGRRAANGEIYDMDKLTAAHRTLPFETRVRVTNLENQREVDVRITDRGPFVKGRIIDLSRAAATEIAMLVPGTARVRVEVRALPGDGADPQTGAFAVQAGAFASKDRAERLREELDGRFGGARLVEREGTPTLWRVLVGRERSAGRAEELARRVRKLAPDAIVVRLDGAP